MNQPLDQVTNTKVDEKESEMNHSNSISAEELRTAILTEFKQVHKLAPADYTENCTNVVMAHFASTIEQIAKEGLPEPIRQNYDRGTRAIGYRDGNNQAIQDTRKTLLDLAKLIREGE